MDAFDTSSLALAVGATSVTLLALMVYVALTGSVYPGFRHWIASVLLIILSLLTSSASLEGTEVQLLPWLVGWAFTIAATVITHAGILLFHGRPVRIRVDITIGLTALALAGLLYRTHGDIGLPLLLVCSATTITLWRGGLSCVRRIRTDLRPACNLFGAVLFVAGFLILARALPYLASTPDVGKPLNPLAETVFFVGSGVIMTSCVFAALLLTVQRQQVELSDMQDVLRRQAGTDPLTGLANRRRFFQETTELLDGLGGKAASAIVLDIDYFKKINDRFGHQVGDLVLRNISRALSDFADGRGPVGRLGGEEFCIVLPIGQIHAAEEAEELRMTIRDLKNSPLKKPVTVSIGVSDVRPTDPEHRYGSL